jgi:putative transcriptional regulator
LQTANLINVPSKVAMLGLPMLCFTYGIVKVNGAALLVNNRLRELRARGWSQGELAEHLVVSRQTVNALETGKYDPSLPLAFKIARMFNLSIESIFIDEAH